MITFSDAVQEGLELLKELIRIDTTAGNANESEAAHVLLQRAGQWEIEASVEEPRKGLGSFVASIPGQSSDFLLLLSHFDSAPAGELREWKYPPFASMEAEGYVWGRGAVDCKGLAAVWWSVMLLLRGKPLRRSLRFAAAAGEEVRSEWGASWLSRQSSYIRHCKAVLNEGGGWELPLRGKVYTLCQVGEKGYARIKLPHEPKFAQRTFLLRADLPAPIRQFLRQAGGIAGQAASYGGSGTARWMTDRLQKQSRYALDTSEMFYHVFEIRADRETQGRWELVCSILPGNRTEAVVEKALRFLSVCPDHCRMVELIEPTLSPARGSLYECIRDLHSTPILPFITPGRSDSQWFRERGIPVYGFFPHIQASDVIRIHQPNERISVEAFYQAVHSLHKIVERFLVE